MSTKQKRAVFMIGVTAAVYGGIRYLLPLALPFFLSYGLARLIWPFVSWAKTRARLPENLGIALSLTALLAVLLAALWWIGMAAAGQLAELAGRLPEYVRFGEAWLLKALEAAGRRFGIGGEGFEQEVRRQIQLTSAALQEKVLPAAAASLIPAARRAGDLFAGAAVAAVSSVFFIKERERIKKWMEESVFRREIRVITRRLGSLGRAFFKTQGLIFLLVTSICVGGLFLLGNRYFLVLGGLIGVLDVLPVFGTGTVLLPWAAVRLCLGDWRQALALAGIYLLTYYLREFLEAHMMGRQLGIGSLEMMIAMYAGLKLFGIGGLFLGPIGWILIKEIDKTLYLR